MKVRELYQLLERDYALNERSSLKTSWQHTKPVIAALGDLEADTITTTMIEEYKMMRLHNGLARQTITNEVSMLRRAFNLALQQERLQRAPRIANLKSSNARSGFLRPAEFQRIVLTLDALEGAVSDVVRLLYLLGWRKQEVLGLKWEEVNVDDGTLCLPQRRNKTRKIRRIKVGGDVHNLLRRRWLQRKGSFVFHRKGKQIKDFRGKWARAALALGRTELLLHDLRRSFARNGILAGVSRKTLMEIAGWTTESVFNRYNIVDEDQMADALNLVSNFANEKQKTRP
jgi:integrase